MSGGREGGRREGEGGGREEGGGKGRERGREGGRGKRRGKDGGKERSSNHILTCQMKRCGVPTLLVPAVDILTSEQFLDTVQIPFLGGIQQSTVSPQQVRQVALLVLHQVQSCQVVTVTTIHISTILKSNKFCEF